VTWERGRKRQHLRFARGVALKCHLYLQRKGPCIRQHTSAYVCIRLHTLAYVSIRQHTQQLCLHTSAYVSIACAVAEASPLGATAICQHTSAYVSIRQHTSAYVSIRQHTSAYVSIRQHTLWWGGDDVTMIGHVMAEMSSPLPAYIHTHRQRTCRRPCLPPLSSYVSRRLHT
jgi:hypothetical protein